MPSRLPSVCAFFVQENALVVDGHSIPMTVSVGVATSVDSDRSFNDLLRRADHALYAAKTRGRNRIEIANDSVDGED